MGTDIFGISVSALNSAQLGLATTEHNIANANTPGFNRQEVVISARPAQRSGAGYLGQGSDATSVRRVYDEFLSRQVVGEQAQSTQLSTYYTQIQQINNMLADQNAGLSPALQAFFGSTNDVANAPESMAARQAMLSSAQSLASRFQSMNQRLADINDSINGRIRASVININSYAQQIAALNHNIVVAEAASGGKPANDLLDQRDLLLTQLNQEVRVGVVKQSDGSINLSIGNGQLLVVGEQAFSLQAVQSLSDPTKLEIAAGSTGGAVIRLQQGAIQGGNVGGLLDFRSQSLDAAQNSLGLVAMGLAGTFNQKHQLGQDLNGALGDNFFTQPVPVININSGNTGTAIINAPSVSDYAALTGSDYSLTYGTGGYTLTRLSDNATLFANQATPNPAPPAVLPPAISSWDGLVLGALSSGAPNVGDSFIIRPTVDGAANLRMNITDPAKIAAAAPMRTYATLANSGTGRISAGTVNAPLPATPDPAHPLTDQNLKQPVTITFTSPTTFDVTGVGAGLPAIGVAYVSGNDISYNGWTTQITGAPGTGDTFTVGSNTSASTDNRNALFLADLQTQSTLYGGTASYQGAYGLLVSQVGSKTREMEVTSKAQETMLKQTIQAQQSVSGVNLDEEAANLMRYQRAYQAAGKAMQIANTLFETLLSIGR